MVQMIRGLRQQSLPSYNIKGITNVIVMMFFKVIEENMDFDWYIKLLSKSANQNKVKLR